MKIGVDAVLLHQAAVQCHPVEEKRDEGDWVALGQASIHLFEQLGEAGAVVAGDFDPEQQDFGICRQSLLYRRGQIPLHPGRGNPPQAIIAAQFQNDDVRPMVAQEPGQAAQPAGAGLAADAGVDKGDRFVFFFQLLRQQRDPSLFHRDTMRRAETVAEHQNGVRQDRPGEQHPNDQKTDSHHVFKILAEIFAPVVITMPAMIVAGQLNKSVMLGDSRLDILTDVNLTIEAGESVAVVGVSGSGKSTLLSLLAGLDLPTSGQVTLAGHPLNGLDEDGRAALRGRLVGFVFQSFQLLPSLTALENVMLPLELKGERRAREMAGDMLGRVGLSRRLKHYPRQLSGGEQQRVALARAFVTEPRILFADEPTGNLDRKTGHQVIELLFELNRLHATTLVLVTHDEALARHCRRTLVLEGGRVVAER